MDFFDLFSALPVPTRGGRPERSPRENLAANIVGFWLPAFDVAVLIFAGVAGRPLVAVLLLPVAFAGLGYLICRRMLMSAAFTTSLTRRCGALCVMWGMCAFFFSVMFFTF